MSGALTGKLSDYFPPEFDERYYLKRNPDLPNDKGFDASAHYQATGRQEGRRASPAADRLHFLSCVPKGIDVLEVGPFHAPSFTGKGARYLDVLDSPALKKHAEAMKLPTDKVPSEIHYVSDTGDLSIVDAQFDVVFSSHAIEHQPNLLGHLNGAAKLLRPGGSYLLIIPDHRYCFDALQARTRVAEVIEAHLENRRFHSLKTIIEHTSQTTHNDPRRHWAGDHGTIENFEPRLEQAIATWRAHQGKYIDMHAWRFTPQSFRGICDNLNALKMLDLVASRVYDTPRDTCEFCVVMEKPVAANQAALAAS